ncbi:hepatitis A virus cellular receptor 1 homolog [Sander lucioperca]|uniref:hepatitis A virus cellular receptor 1 homolog n=1 Tax=Sander lucioperca TaxID=283035 RepID=UPI0016536ECF|nr:hepatitis A virus cellular receptor 1 homolog [Sander lucioperca]
MKLVLLLALLTVSECESSTFVGRTGEDVTLSCKYDITYYKALSVCWGRGQIPVSGCGNQLISTDGHKVKEETRVSSRYKLLGRLGDGDVSLTILNISETDAGRYACRVDIPGWFNDDKHHFILIVERAPQTTPSTTYTAGTTQTCVFVFIS